MPASAAASPQSSVLLHIDELVLDGFAPGDGYRIGEALERELTRLFAEQSVPAPLAGGGDLATIEVAAVEVAPDAPAEAIGAQVAQAVYGGLRGPTR